MMRIILSRYYTSLLFGHMVMVFLVLWSKFGPMVFYLFGPLDSILGPSPICLSFIVVVIVSFWILLAIWIWMRSSVFHFTPWFMFISKIITLVKFVQFLNIKFGKSFALPHLIFVGPVQRFDCVLNSNKEIVRGGSKMMSQSWTPFTSCHLK